MSGVMNAKQERKDAGRSKSRSKPQEPEFEYLNVDLTAKDSERLEALVDSGEFPLAGILELSSMGYKFSLSPDKEHKRFVASLTDKSPDSAFWNKCLTGSGATALDAWHSVAYKHYTIAGGDWADLPHSTGGRYG